MWVAYSMGAMTLLASMLLVMKFGTNAGVPYRSC